MFPWASAVPRLRKGLGLVCTLCLPSMLAVCEQPALRSEDVPSYLAWRESAGRLAALRLSYEYAYRPTQEFIERTRREKLSGDLHMIICSVGTRREGTLRVSRSGGNLDRDSVLERFEDSVRAWRYAPGADELYPPQPDTSESFVEIHGDGVYFHHYPEQKRGAIWHEWKDRPGYPVAWVMPPDPATSTLKTAAESGSVLDYVSESWLLTRYFLDPAHGSMPVRIEYYQVLEDGGLFIFRYFTVEEYTATPGGAFLPAKSTMHDFARKRADGSVRVDRESAFAMTAYEENVPFGKEEFLYEFPQGTYVRDNTKNTGHIVGEEERTPNPVHPSGTRVVVP